MPVSDYAHHNEQAEQIWWQEEGQWADEPDQHEPDDDDANYHDAHEWECSGVLVNEPCDDGGCDDCYG